MSRMGLTVGFPTTAAGAVAWIGTAALFLPTKSSAGQQPTSPLSREPVRLCFAVRRA
jgi:hypothetical protein